MPACVLMKAFESTPARYERAMHWLTLGGIGKLRRSIAGSIDGKRRVLELGCGTGRLAVMMARAGARVLAIDASESMLETARGHAGEVGAAGSVEFRRLSLMEIDSLPGRSFDLIVGSLVLSELTDLENEFVLRESHRLLAPGGELWIGDETLPAGRFKRRCFGLLRLPFRLAAYLMTQARSLQRVDRALRLLYFLIELPLMLFVFALVPAPSRPLKNIEGMMRDAGFRPIEARDYLGGTLRLVRAEVT